jgi:hypothetical protein
LENARRAQATAKQTLSPVAAKIKGFLAKHRAKALPSRGKARLPGMGALIRAPITFGAPGLTMF